MPLGIENSNDKNCTCIDVLSIDNEVFFSCRFSRNFIRAQKLARKYSHSYIKYYKCCSHFMTTSTLLYSTPMFMRGEWRLPWKSECLREAECNHLKQARLQGMPGRTLGPSMSFFMTFFLHPTKNISSFFSSCYLTGVGFVEKAW